VKRPVFLRSLAAGAAAVPLQARAAPAPDAVARRALVLTGAGALGAYEAGAAIALLRAGERFDIICGTSIGAINAAFIAMGAIDELDEVWHSIARYRLIRPGKRLAPMLAALNELGDSGRGVLSRPYNVLHGAAILYAGGRVFGETGFFESAPIVSFLRERLDLRRVATTFAWSATNLTTALSEAFYIAPPAQADLPSHPAYRVHRLDPSIDADAALFPEAIRASAAIPLVFRPVTLSPRDASPGAYADGGIAQNAPIGIARHLGATDLVGITASPPATIASVATLSDVLMQSYAANQNRLIFAQFADGTTGTRLRSSALVQPSSPLALGPLDFGDQPALDAAFTRGAADALRGPIALPPDIPVS